MRDEQPSQGEHLPVMVPDTHNANVLEGASEEQRMEGEDERLVDHITARAGASQKAAQTAPSDSFSAPRREAAVPPVTDSVPDERRRFIAHVSESTDGIDLPACLRGRYEEDNFFKAILEHLKQYKNFRTAEGLVFIKEQGRECLCIPNIRVNGRSAREIVILHAHSLLAHLGSLKTLGLLRDHVWWKTMSADVEKYCATCMTCKRSKPDNQKPYGLLNPLPVPNYPWEAMGIDFVGPLPESKDRDATYDSITVVIDLLTAMVHLIPSRINYTAKNIAELIFAEIYKLHGMPKAIISDRDVLFTSSFWSHLHRLVGVELRMSSAYHPQSDGSTERANRTVTQMLRQCISPNQRDWVTKLPAIEFAINLARSESTGYAPFFLNTGRMPRPMIWNNPSTDEYPAVRAYVQRVKYALMAAHDSIIAARVKQTRNANRHRRPAPFVQGDLVYLSTKNLSLPRGLARKLIPKYIGPYQLLRDYGNNSFQVELSRNLKRRGIHDVFHSSLLRIHEPNDDRLFPGRLDSQVAELEEQDNEWAIDRVVSHKGKGRDATFEAVWKSGDRTWVPWATIGHLDAVQAYLELLGFENVDQLGEGSGDVPDDPQLYVGGLEFSGLENVGRRRYIRGGDRRRRLQDLASRKTSPSHSVAPRTALERPLPSRRLSRSLLFTALLLVILALTAMVNNVNQVRGISSVICLRQTFSAMLYMYVPDQVRRFIAFDRALRDGAVTEETHLPGGYDEFAELWAQDADCPHQFSMYDLETGTITIRGRPLPNDFLRDFAAPPATPIAPPPSQIADSPLASMFTARTQKIAADLMVDAAEQLHRQKERRFEEYLGRERRRQDKKRGRANDPSEYGLVDSPFGGAGPSRPSKRARPSPQYSPEGPTASRYSPAASSAIEVEPEVFTEQVQDVEQAEEEEPTDEVLEAETENAEAEMEEMHED
ncbi:hypothetical protein EVJ58_g10514 [Rhodofomes roseus]|uniref:Integrase catalytic domain-containing protein n=1 Tax=Rhodofomes roseus TaxID=34475 RepID=A0A4Y9XN63_9APHY|nr:hypothetical protein EVJ58_g10514 [Rhodofomes roseus]